MNMPHTRITDSRPPAVLCSCCLRSDSCDKLIGMS